MKKRSVAKYILIFILLFTLNTRAAGPESIVVGPGIVHHKIDLTEGPWVIHVLEIDLQNEFVRIESAKAKKRIIGREKVSTLTKQHTQTAHRIIGAINADFFSATGVPVGAQVVAGQMVQSPTFRSTFGVTADKKSFISKLNLDAGYWGHSGEKNIISSINRARSTNELILYNSYSGEKTGTNQWGDEVILKLKTPPVVNDTMRAMVVEIDSLEGNNQIPIDGLVLSGHDRAGQNLRNKLKRNDVVKIFIGLKPITQQIETLTGGLPRIIRNGKISVEYEQEKISKNFALERHPRTAVGISAAGNRIYFVTVDGRQPGYSVGMSLFELAGFLLNFGIHDALNLDGGGSTTMVIHGKVVNRPSDTAGERAIANALFAVSTAPQGPLSTIRIEPTSIAIKAGQNVIFNVRGYDRYFNPVAINSSELSWSCDNTIGNITQQGFFTSAVSLSKGDIYVKYKNIMSTASVSIIK